eukprot:TRINITY_DN1754_c0_g2_i2.p2 TRINITY_DN1754_c0_g2~~TRINITY_DN1754_c0_g2_i2.p2  ORF type:complete len:426 (+),score=104.27 TRINITY_DN1754_c0_g2_i2:1351-2628(+)
MSKSPNTNDRTTTNDTSSSEDSNKRNLRNVFDSLDVNKDGSLDFHELQRGFKAAGLNYNDDQVHKMIESIDANKNHQIEFDEFYQFASGRTGGDHNITNISEYWLQYSNKPIIHDTPSAWRTLVAGGMAGAVSRTCTSPLERLKILNQVRGLQTIGQNEYKGVWSSLVNMARIEGFRGFFKGNGTNVIRIAPYSAIQFMSYEKYKRLFMDMNAENSRQKGNISYSGHLSAVQNLVAGGLAGVTSLLCTYPLDLVRSRLTIQTTASKYTGITDTFKTVVAEEGARGLYKGMFTSILGVAPYVAINFTTYETLKRRFMTGHTPGVMESLAYGAAAGATAQTFTYPIDLLRRRLQMQGIGGTEPKYKGTVHAVKTIISEEGFLALYRGMIPCYLKVIPAISISFCVYEVTSMLLGIDPKKKSGGGGGF